MSIGTTTAINTPAAELLFELIDGPADPKQTWVVSNEPASGILGTLYSGAAFGILLGPVLAGAVFDRIGSYVPVMWACIILATLSAISSAQLLRDRRPTY